LKNQKKDQKTYNDYRSTWLGPNPRVVDAFVAEFKTGETAGGRALELAISLNLDRAQLF